MISVLSLSFHHLVVLFAYAGVMAYICPCCYLAAACWEGKHVPFVGSLTPSRLMAFVFLTLLICGIVIVFAPMLRQIS